MKFTTWTLRYNKMFWVTIDALGEHADTWAPDEDEVRHYHLRHFPYTVRYVLEGGVATVLAVGHQRRMPGYWRQR